eukprot:CAMPEP_0118710058 /NCGR_PEP_ID=MMETSP0800-20121206/23104_1 /TAXON_ID=210618 ORGANISM="Striatella unipunctata, Strain CCMP2910" /NCGR_SAMPLE_ID=MMETSP0800 /ASSEMBLY_ACC=CAM_ASM_000638 /LENGTH=129 /DNA_ID=CAMNT_0006614065 /DNA_START=204 /DNA_END=593 /DNA_ORIENTATION=+
MVVLAVACRFMSDDVFEVIVFCVFWSLGTWFLSWSFAHYASTCKDKWEKISNDEQREGKLRNLQSGMVVTKWLVFGIVLCITVFEIARRPIWAAKLVYVTKHFLANDNGDILVTLRAAELKFNGPKGWS